jgi:hypothetical protein
LCKLRELEKFADNTGFLDAIGRIKRVVFITLFFKMLILLQDNKLRVAQFIKEQFDIDINPASL